MWFHGYLVKFQQRHKVHVHAPVDRDLRNCVGGIPPLSLSQRVKRQMVQTFNLWASRTTCPCFALSWPSG